MSLEIVSQHITQLKKGARIGVCGHTRPDGDALGSVLALSTALDEGGYTAVPLLADDAQVPRIYSFLPSAERVVTPSKALEEHMLFDLLIILDTPVVERLADGKEYLGLASTVMRIDHHHGREDFAQLTWQDTEASSTGELVLELIESLNLPLNSAVANALYVAVLTDTGGFQHSNVNERSFFHAGLLMRAGADPSLVARKLFHSKSHELLALEARVMDHMVFAHGGAVVYSHVSSADYKETGADRSESENLIELIRVARGIQVAFLVTMGEQGPRVSLRSQAEFNVAQLAEQFGGGGHPAAAGITWPDKNASLATIVDALLEGLPEKTLD